MLLPDDRIRDAEAPSVEIIFPELNDRFGVTPPNFTLSIEDINLESSWYMVDNGTSWSENVTFTGSSGKIAQSAWDAVGNGTITLRFFANDTNGNLGNESVVIRKEIYDPVITICSPLTDEEFGNTPPDYTVVTSKGTFDLSTTWYRLFDGVKWSDLYNFTENSGTINQTAWDACLNGDVRLRFNVNDSMNTITYDDVNVTKDSILTNIIDHNCAHKDDLESIPIEWINASKEELNIAYGHTSHGSQLTDGMANLDTFMGGEGTYIFGNDGGGDDTKLEFYDFNGDFGGGLTTTTANDLGNPNDDAWAAATEEYLDLTDTNVIMWSWCDIGGHDVDGYITHMEDLIGNYSAGGPKGRTAETEVTFIFMTGHVDGNGIGGTNNLQNEKIRAHCLANDRILFDFADIESYGPDDTYYLDDNVDDGCNYDGGNWATEYQEDPLHPVDVDWYTCGSAHSEPLNANFKAYACWYLFAVLAGWDGN